MAELIDKEKLEQDLKELADANAMRGYDTAYDVVMDCINLMKKQSLTTETEIRNRAMEEFCKKLHELEFDNRYGRHIVLTPKELDEIAEELKGEANEIG